jgi:uncharacterized protein YggE
MRMSINISTDSIIKTVQIVLLLAITGILIRSQPWNNSSATSDARKITVSGSATIEATPDEFTFYPSFQKNGVDKDALKTELSATANDAVTKLKELGVEEKNIKLDASSYDQWYWMADEEGTLIISLTIKATGEELVQSIQNYLLTTSAEGQLTPQATFSRETQKKLDKQAVEEATNDAKEKAQTQAQQFGAEIGDVIEVGQSRDTLFMDYGYREGALDSSSSSASLPLLPGQNEYSQTVTVTYELK